MSHVPRRSALFTTTILVVALSQGQSIGKDIVDTAVEAGSFKTLAAALQAADLVEALKSDGPFTVFAPTDEAFAQLPHGTVESLLKPENKQQLIDVLTFHVVPGRLPAEKVVTLSGATSLNGQRIDINVSDAGVRVDQANVVKTDIACDNGIIHVIDSVILPASDDIPTTASQAGMFQTLLTAAKAAGLVDALSSEGPLTVFAPTDEAFAKLPAGTVETLLKGENKAKLASILKYHVVAGRVYSPDAISLGKATTLQGQTVNIAVKGGVPMVNDATLVTTDLDASNGVIHVIDSVMLPPENTSARHPRTMIEHAIAQGAPLYNAGHAEACANIYMTTARELLAMDNSGMCCSTTGVLRTALRTSEHAANADAQAWTMRHALDSAYSSLR